MSVDSTIRELALRWELGVRRRVGNAEEWEALMHPGQKLKPGAQVLFERDGVRLHGEVLERHFHGRRTIRSSAPTART